MMKTPPRFVRSVPLLCRQGFIACALLLGLTCSERRREGDEPRRERKRDAGGSRSRARSVTPAAERCEARALSGPALTPRAWGAHVADGSVYVVATQGRSGHQLLRVDPPTTAARSIFVAQRGEELTLIAGAPPMVVVSRVVAEPDAANKVDRVLVVEGDRLVAAGNATSSRADVLGTLLERSGVLNSGLAVRSIQHGGETWLTWGGGNAEHPYAVVLRRLSGAPDEKPPFASNIAAHFLDVAADGRLVLFAHDANAARIAFVESGAVGTPRELAWLEVPGAMAFAFASAPKPHLAALVATPPEGNSKLVWIPMEGQATAATDEPAFGANGFRMIAALPPEGRFARMLVWIRARPGISMVSCEIPP
jgi:hypothetical protein